MPNPNYIRGRRFEYEIKKRWSDGHYKTLRASGSHGEFDIIVYEGRWDEGPEGCELYKPGSTREVRGRYEYLTFVTPIKGYGIQCKVRKVRGKGRK